MDYEDFAKVTHANSGLRGWWHLFAISHTFGNICEFVWHKRRRDAMSTNVTRKCMSDVVGRHAPHIVRRSSLPNHCFVFGCKLSVLYVCYTCDSSHANRKTRIQRSNLGCAHTLTEERREENECHRQRLWPMIFTVNTKWIVALLSGTHSPPAFALWPLTGTETEIRRFAVMVTLDVR